MTPDPFDLVVLGSGPAGEKGAAQAAYFGKRVALVEKEPVLGGAAAGDTRTGTTGATTTATTVPVMDTAIAVGPEWLSYRVGSLAPAITMALSPES